MTTRSWHRGRAAVAFAFTLTAGTLLAALGGCASSPPNHFYTLSGGSAATPGPTAAQPLLIEVPVASIPQQVARPQFVVTNGPGQVELKEQQRWAAPLGDEIAGAISERLTATLPAIDVFRTPHAAGSMLYRVTVKVQRFESVPGSRATIDAVWSVRRTPGEATLSCRSVVTENVGDGYAALVDGHRRALLHISDDIAAGIRSLAAAPDLRAAVNGTATPTGQPAPAPAPHQCMNPGSAPAAAP